MKAGIIALLKGQRRRADKRSGQQDIFAFSSTLSLLSPVPSSSCDWNTAAASNTAHHPGLPSALASAGPPSSMWGHLPAPSARCLVHLSINELAFPDASACDACGLLGPLPDNVYGPEPHSSILWMDRSEAHCTWFPRGCHWFQGPFAHRDGRVDDASLYWLSSLPVSCYPVLHPCPLGSLLKMAYLPACKPCLRALLPGDMQALLTGL